MVDVRCFVMSELKALTRLWVKDGDLGRGVEVNDVMIRDSEGTED